MEDEGASEKPVDILDSETESAKLSSIHPKQLVIAWIDLESEEEEEAMDLKKRPGLKGLLPVGTKLSSIHPKQLVIARIDSESKEEEEAMDLKKRPGLKGLLASRNKGGNSKEAPKTQPPVVLPPPPPPSTDLGLQAMPNLKKRRIDYKIEEGEVAPWKDNKQQRIAKDPRDKRSTSVDSRDEARYADLSGPGLLG